MNGFQHKVLLERVENGLREADQLYAVSTSQLVLHAHPMTLQALAREVNGAHAMYDGLILVKVVGIPVKADRSLEPSRLVLRYEVEC
jgi:hypothetical protein